VLWVLWCLYRFASLHIPSKCEGSKECKSAVWTFSIIFYHGLLQSRPIQPRNTVLYPAKVCFIWLVFFRRGSEIRYVCLVVGGLLSVCFIVSMHDDFGCSSYVCYQKPSPWMNTETTNNLSCYLAIPYSI
jgi:hypothetical protein